MKQNNKKTGGRIQLTQWTGYYSQRYACSFLEFISPCKSQFIHLLVLEIHVINCGANYLHISYFKVTTVKNSVDFSAFMLTFLIM